MKLIHDFFQIIETTRHEEGVNITISFNPDHIVYTGHFPGHPVTPGVVQIQIVHELLEHTLQRKLKLSAIPNVKFLKMLNPLETIQIDIGIDFKLTEEHLQIKAVGEKYGQTYFRLQAIYQLVA